MLYSLASYSLYKFLNISTNKKPRLYI